jgi:alpha-amylase
VTPICLYLQVHQPYRLRHYTYFDVGSRHDYFDDEANAGILRRVAERAYRPATGLFYRLAGRFGDRFSVAFSLSGTVIDQLRDWSGKTLDAFRQLAATGRVEFLAETYFHSLASIEDLEEFRAQVNLHRRAIESLAGKAPQVFRNTELLFSDQIAAQAQELGFRGILADGIEPLLGHRRPDFVYRCAGLDIRLLLRNYRLSDDIAFRFSERGWEEWPLTAEKYLQWIASLDGQADVVNLFMDFETFGEHQRKETGIFDFFSAFVERFIEAGGRFVTPSEAIARFAPRGQVHAPRLVSWADEARDASAWVGNRLQRHALDQLYAIKHDVLGSGDVDLITSWRRLTTSDHLYYMSTKSLADGTVHQYFNPYGSPYEAYITFMNVLADIEGRVGSPGGL